MTAEFDQLVAEFEKFQSRIKRIDDKFAGIGAMQEEISALEAGVSSPGRSVTVIAGPGGAIKDIRLSAEALRQQPGSLSAEIMSTLQRAVAEVARKQAAIVDTHMGGELHLTDQVLETQAQVFGTTVEELRSNLQDELPRATPAQHHDHDHEDYGASSIADTRRQQYSPPPATGGGSGGDAFLGNLLDDDDYEDRR